MQVGKPENIVELHEVLEMIFTSKVIQYTSILAFNN